MSTDEPAAVEEREGGRVAGGCVLAVTLGGAGAVAYAVPEVAYFVTGLLTAAGVRKARAWAAGRRGVVEAVDEEQVDIVTALQAMAAGGGHILLTQLQATTGLPDTKAVRALLDEAGVRVRAGVRTTGGNGPGVHHDDVPPLPDAESGTPSEGCLCSSTANTNANNVPAAGAQEGLHVEPIGHAGAVVRVHSERRTYKVGG